MLDIIAGPNPEDAPAINLQLPAAKQKKLSEFRVLAWFDDPLCTIDTEIRTNYQHVVDSLREHGAKVTVAAPQGVALKDYFAVYLNLLGSVMGTSNSPPQRRVMGMVAPLFKRLETTFNLAPLFDNFLVGVAQSHAEWLKYNEKRLRLKRKFLAATADYDVILTPITPTLAIKHQQKLPMPLRSLRINGQQRNYMEHLIWISPATLLGLPAVSAPVGVSKEQLPINIQIIAPPYHDKTAIRFASLLEKSYGGFNIPNGYA
jgi:amidase